MKMLNYIQKNFSFLLILLFSLTIISCSKEDPDPPISNVNNNGTGGGAVTCDGITCFNGGTCYQGECTCLEGYYGTQCENQTTPDRMKITGIRVTDFPQTESDGGGWDLTSGPDIFIRLLYNDNTIYTSNYYENANANNTYNVTPDQNINFNNPTDSYLIRIYDFDDLSDNDFMGGIQFTPYWSNTNAFPSTLNLDAGAGFAVEIDVEYIF